jgi:hypothetical protein
METQITDKMKLNQDLQNRIIASLETVLKAEFKGRKSEIDIKHGRLNFACPYCGDGEGDNKKRGNVYWNTLMYHCYNGGCSKQHTNLVTLLKDFDEGFTNLDDLNNVLDFIKANKVSVVSEDFLQFGVFETLNSLSVSKEDLAKALGARPLWKTDSAYKYLQSRLLHRKVDNFLFDQRKNKLYILNLKNDRVIGLQIRNMNEKYYGAKYISYNIEKIYTDILKDLDGVMQVKDREKVNTLSLYFGIFECDFTSTFTIFEGPMDHLLYPKNSIAISGAGKNTDMFDDNPNARYFFDNDKIGKEIMHRKLSAKRTVFLWKKFFEISGIPTRKIKDFNDIIMYCYRNKSNGHTKIEECFSNNKFDTYYL